VLRAPSPSPARLVAGNSESIIMTEPVSLFSPARIGGIEVANRIAMAPLTRARAGMDGVQTPLAAEYYGQRASTGLIISEATNISRQGRGYAFTPGIYTDAHVEAWKPVTSAVHAKGGKIVMQLWHVGRFSHTSLQENGAAPVAPSVVRAGEMTYLENGFEQPSEPRALELDEIAAIIEDYKKAAANAKAAGFDGVEVHSANSYLLDQFIRDSINHRTDRYGGSVENRTRLTLEVAEAVAGVFGANRVGIRLSPITRAAGDTPFDSDPQGTYGFLAERLGELNLAYLHCVEGQTRGPNGATDFDFQALRKKFGGHYIANNGYDRDLALKTIEDGKADMVAFGRPFIGNPDLVERLRIRAPLTEAPQGSFYGGGAEGYIDWPTLDASAA